MKITCIKNNDLTAVPWSFTGDAEAISKWLNSFWGKNVREAVPSRLSRELMFSMMEHSSMTMDVDGYTVTLKA